MSRKHWRSIPTTNVTAPLAADALHRACLKEIQREANDSRRHRDEFSTQKIKMSGCQQGAILFQWLTGRCLLNR
jgi:hypothetical protein